MSIKPKTTEGMIPSVVSSNPKCLLSRKILGVLEVALQENGLQLNHLGAVVESATAGMATLSLCRRINTPYVFVLEHNGEIYFLALCGQDSWRNPADGDPLIVSDAPLTEEG